jgi:hypothetical protein
MSSSLNTLATALPNSGGSFAVHTADVSQTLVQHVAVTLTTAQILTLNATPIVLLPAPGAGMSNIIDYGLFRYISGGTAFASGGTITIGYVSGAAVVNTIANTVINSTSSSDTVLVTSASNITALQNTAIQITNATGAFTTGNGSVTINLWYSII